MKKIALLFLGLIAFCFSTSPLDPEYYGFPRVYTDVTNRVWYFYDSFYHSSSYCTVGSDSITQPDLSSFGFIFGSLDSSVDHHCFFTHARKDILCDIPDSTYDHYRFNVYSFCYSTTPPEPEDNGTCPDSPYENSYSFPEEGICADCSDKVDSEIPKCICEYAGDSYSGPKITSYILVKVNGKCYMEKLFSCDSRPKDKFTFYEPVSCPTDDNETNGTTPSNPDDNNTTPSNPDDNSTNPTNPGGDPGDDSGNNTNPNTPDGDPGGSPGGDPGGSPGGDPGGTPGGIPGGTPGTDGNTTNPTPDSNSTDNGTCWWCSGEKSADPKSAFDALSNEINVLSSSYSSVLSLIENGFSLNIPDREYKAPSTTYHGQTLTFDVCTPFSVFAPIIQFIITICGILITLKIYFWSV
jgi:hypothetical protein